MEKLDLKKIIVIIIVLILLAGLIILVLKSNPKEKDASEEEIKISENTLSYILRSKTGYATTYNGVELLYENNKTTLSDLNNQNILNTAILYAVDNLDTTVKGYIIEELKGKGYDSLKYSFYNGEAIREAIEKLFGIKWQDKNLIGESNFIYDFIYNSDYDVYLKTKNNNNLAIKNNNDIAYKIIETKKVGKDTLKVKIKIAYLYFNNNNIYYYSDIKNTNKVYEQTINTPEISNEYIDKFDTYLVTLKKNNDNYVFDSIEKEA